jgi:hypothetical protein
LRKKDNKKNLKIRLVFNRMVRVFFLPYYSYTIPLSLIIKTNEKELHHLISIFLGLLIFIHFLFVKL